MCQSSITTVPVYPMMCSGLSQNGMPAVLRQPRVPGGSFQLSAGGSFQFSGLFDRRAPGSKRLNLAACGLCRTGLSTLGNFVRPVSGWFCAHLCFGNFVRPSLVGGLTVSASGTSCVLAWSGFNKLPFVPAISLPHKVYHAGVASQRVGFMMWASGRGPGFWPWRL